MIQDTKVVDRLAVILVGEYRTWKQASRYLFRFFRQQAKQVDYFFVTWNVTTQTGEMIPVTDEDVISPFVKFQENLVSHSILEPIGRHRTTFYNQSWLAKVGNTLKREHELANHFVYDQVVETRPDCYFRPNKEPWVPCKDFEYEGSVPERWDSGFLGIGDVYFRTTSFTNDIIADRYHLTKPKEHLRIINEIHWEFTNHHWSILELFYKRLLKPLSYRERADFEFFCCVRPNFPQGVDLDTLPWEDLDRLFIGYGKPHDDFFYGPRSSAPLVDDITIN